jgi:hypothetical protein
MAQTLEKRVEELERRLDELTSQPAVAGKRDWLKTFGLSRDDEGFSELVKLGQEYRRNSNQRE